MTCPQPAENTASRTSQLEEIERLIQARDARAAIERAVAFQPRDRREQVEIERLQSWARYILGDDRAARRHMIRALRGASRQPALRVHARSNLAELLNRIGEVDRAERELRRALAESHAHGVARAQQPWLLNALALIHRRRGMVGFAIRTYEEALEAARRPGSEVRGWGAIASNLALAHLQWGDRERAKALLDDLEGADEQVLTRAHRAGFHLTRALHALEVGDFDAGERFLDRMRSEVGESDLRASFLERGARSELAIARGHAARAVPLLEEMLREAEAQPILRDLYSSAARRLASALLDLGAPKQALEKARLAVQRGRGIDVQEWAAGLRVTARCLVALGRTEEARATLGEALSILHASECHAERRRLNETLQDLGLAAEESEAEAPPEFAPPEPEVPLPEASARAENRLPLSDGRVFLTCDVELVASIRHAAGDRLPVLIVGETGTGKELVARLIHELGADGSRPWVVVDCTTLTESLVEAELFGAARGAFTGAVSDRPGLVAEAEGGTLFLDELPELATTVQAKLLRLLQEGTYRRVGETRTRTIHTRVVAATSRDPETMVAAGALRPDLFYRLHGHRIAISPLRDRPDDLRLLARERAREARLKGVTDKALGLLRGHAWPGNVRELEMLIRVTSAHVPTGSWLDETAFRHLARRPGPRSEPAPGLRTQRRESEKEFLRRLIERHGGNIAAAAREISMSRQGLHKALRRVGLI